MPKSDHWKGLKSFRVKEEGREREEKRGERQWEEKTGQEEAEEGAAVPYPPATLTLGNEWVSSALIWRESGGVTGRIREPGA